MKELILGIILVILLGLFGFLYNNAKAPSKINDLPRACTEEAKICPDGSAVGRSGPNCEFTPCPTDKIEFIAPAGYVLSNSESFVKDRLARFVKDPENISNSISIYAYKKDAEHNLDYILENNVFLSPSDMNPKVSDYEKVQLGDREVYRIINERFEGAVELTYAIDLPDFVVLVSHRDISVEHWMQDFSLGELEDLNTTRAVVESVREK